MKSPRNRSVFSIILFPLRSYLIIGKVYFDAIEALDWFFHSLWIFYINDNYLPKKFSEYRVNTVTEYLNLFKRKFGYIYNEEVISVLLKTKNRTPIHIRKNGEIETFFLTNEEAIEQLQGYAPYEINNGNRFCRKILGLSSQQLTQIYDNRTKKNGRIGKTAILPGSLTCRYNKSDLANLDRLNRKLNIQYREWSKGYILDLKLQRENRKVQARKLVLALLLPITMIGTIVFRLPFWFFTFILAESKCLLRISRFVFERLFYLVLILWHQVELLWYSILEDWRYINGVSEIRNPLSYPKGIQFEATIVFSRVDVILLSSLLVFLVILAALAVMIFG
ncbi:MAG: hypothetical protein AAGG51_27495 [Cyanobacteria bacterium P01_G01_bin.54]